MNIDHTLEIFDVVKVMLPAVIAFAVGIIITPFWTNFLYYFKIEVSV
jgi:hypothetical protein